MQARIKSVFRAPIRSRIAAILLAGTLIVIAGCRQQASEQPQRPDRQIAQDIHAKIGGEAALTGQDIRVTVNSGVATLAGTARDDASRALAGNDAGAINGVKTVVNNLTVAPPQSSTAPAAEKPRRETSARKPREDTASKPGPPTRVLLLPVPAAPAMSAPSPTPAAPAMPSPSQPGMLPPPPPGMPPLSLALPPPLPLAAVAQPPAQPKPAAKTVILPAGTVLQVRITDALTSATAQPNQTFHGSLAGDVIASGMVVLPQGAAVVGRVVDARDAGHLNGSSLLSIELTEIEIHGRSIALATTTYSKQGQGRGTDTLAKTGGGAALGAMIGGLAGGGRDAAIGALSGGAMGTAVNGVTRGQQVQIPSETLVAFRLQSPISVAATQTVGGGQQTDESQPQLQWRPNQ